MAEMPPPQISIIGGGIAGLVAGRCLRYRGIASIIFEKDTEKAGSARYNYGITLQSSAYSALLPYLDIDERTFRSSLAVDAAVGGRGKAGQQSDGAAFRANRQRFESLLREGLDIKWEHHLTGITNSGSSATLDFRNAQPSKASLVVGAEGPHSQLRKHISPATNFNVLPYAVYNGKRRLSRTSWDAHFAAALNDGTVLEQKHGEALLSISINDLTPEGASISYTYSRPSRANDPIFDPSRPNAGAKDIPVALFDEVAALQGLDDPFKEVFDPDKMRQDRLLNWLMRSLSLPAQDLQVAVGQGILLIGDAAHATPILGGNGANEAIRDGVELAKFISERGAGQLGRFYEGRLERWKKDREESARRLEEMHAATRANL